MNFLVVGLGGFIGASGRYLVSRILEKNGLLLLFPLSTFTVNLIGSFFIGTAAAYFAKNNMMGSTAQIFLMVGVLGGFTTFSAFSLETVNLIIAGKWLPAFFYIFFSVLLCVLGTAAGRSVLS